MSAALVPIGDVLEAATRRLGLDAAFGAIGAGVSDGSIAAFARVGGARPRRLEPSWWARITTADWLAGTVTIALPGDVRPLRAHHLELDRDAVMRSLPAPASDACDALPAAGDGPPLSESFMSPEFAAYVRARATAHRGKRGRRGTGRDIRIGRHRRPNRRSHRRGPKADLPLRGQSSTRRATARPAAY